MSRYANGGSKIDQTVSEALRNLGPCADAAAKDKGRWIEGKLQGAQDP
jgi:hypothetical protein